MSQKQRIPMLACVLLTLCAGVAEVRTATTLGELSSSFEELASRVGSAVVMIEISGFGPSPGQSRSATGILVTRQGSGSGVILSADGYIVTNAHVLEGAQKIHVQLIHKTDPASGLRSVLKPEGARLPAEVVGMDTETDLAVLKVEAADLDHLELADSDELRLGQVVLAFGSPMGLQNSVTMGVVSATARQLRPDDPMIYIQTDAPINPGNSGGPLVDATGRVVGINSAILSQSGGHEGIGFAAPSNIVQSVFDQIRENGRVRRGEIGVNAQTITPSLAQGLGLPRDWGVILADVYPTGPADLAGLAVGDVILSLDGKTMENGRQFDVNLYRRPPGAVVRVAYLRGKQRRTASIVVKERADDPQRFASALKPEEDLIPELGVFAVELDQTILELLPGFRNPEGLLVVAKAALAPPSAAELLPGDVIHTLNRNRIKDRAGLAAALAALEPGDPAVLQIERMGKLGFVVFEAE